MSDRYPGRDFVPALPYERLRPLAERLGVHIGPGEEDLAKARRQATFTLQAERETDVAIEAARVRQRKRRQEVRRLLGRVQP